MKKNLIYISLCLCLFLIAGCSGSDSEPENVEVYLEANTNRILLKEEGGTAYINIASNTKWTVLVENEEIPVVELDVTPLSGDGDGTIKITYGREINKVQCEHATLIFYYYSDGKRVSKEVILSRQENDNGEENMIPLTALAKAINSFPATFKTADGYKIITTSTAFVTLGEMYYINGLYQESMIDHNAKEIHLNLLNELVCISGSPIVMDNIDKYSSNAPFYASNYDGIAPGFFDESILIVPLFFWIYNANVTDIQEELNRHSFILVYDSTGNSDSILKLCLLHSILEDEEKRRTMLTAQYCSFNISSVISRFKLEKGMRPSKITIEYKVNLSSDRLDLAKTEKYTLDYKFQ